MANCWERAVPLAFHLCCFLFVFYFSAVLIVGVPFPFGVKGRMWNSILSVPFIYLTLAYQLYAYGRHGTGFKLI